MLVTTITCQPLKQGKDAEDSSDGLEKGHFLRQLHVFKS